MKRQITLRNLRNQKNQMSKNRENMERQFRAANDLDMISPDKVADWEQILDSYKKKEETLEARISHLRNGDES